MHLFQLVSVLSVHLMDVFLCVTELKEDHNLGIYYSNQYQTLPNPNRYSNMFWQPQFFFFFKSSVYYTGRGGRPFWQPQSKCNLIILEAYSTMFNRSWCHFESHDYVSTSCEIHCVLTPPLSHRMILNNWRISHRQSREIYVTQIAPCWDAEHEFQIRRSPRLP